MNRQDKKNNVELLSQKLASSEIVIVVHYKGLTVSAMDSLRNGLSESGASIQVAKNTLVNIAASHLQCRDAISPLLSGPTAIVTSADPVGAAKATADFAKENENLIILGGAMGAEALNNSQIEALAKLPSLDSLRGQIVGLIQAPAQKIVGSMSASIRQVVQVTKAYSEKQ